MGDDNTNIAPAEAIKSAAISQICTATDRQMALFSRGRSVYAYNVKTKKLELLAGATRYFITGLYVSPSGTRIAAITEDHTAFLITLSKDGEKPGAPVELPKARYDSAWFKNEDALLLGDMSGQVFQLDLNKINSEDKLENVAEVVLGHYSVMTVIRHTPDGKYIITADRDEKIRVTDASEPCRIHTYCLGHRQFISYLEMVGGNRLCSGSGDGSIAVWDYESGELVKRVAVGKPDSVLQDNGYVDAIQPEYQKPDVLKCMASNGKYVAAATENSGAVYLYDLSSLKELARYTLSDHMVSSMVFVGDGDSLLCGDSAGGFTMLKFAGATATLKPCRPMDLLASAEDGAMLQSRLQEDMFEFTPRSISRYDMTTFRKRPLTSDQFSSKRVKGPGSRSDI